jgi:hypothetical protein
MNPAAPVPDHRTQLIVGDLKLPARGGRWR